jgi:hypothetical protein
MYGAPPRSRIPRFSVAFGNRVQWIAVYSSDRHRQTLTNSAGRRAPTAILLIRRSWVRIPPGSFFSGRSSACRMGMLVDNRAAWICLPTGSYLVGSSPSTLFTSSPSSASPRFATSRNRWFSSLKHPHFPRGQKYLLNLATAYVLLSTGMTANRIDSSYARTGRLVRGDSGRVRRMSCDPMRGKEEVGWRRFKVENIPLPPRPLTFWP